MKQKQQATHTIEPEPLELPNTCILAGLNALDLQARQFKLPLILGRTRFGGITPGCEMS